PSRWGWPAGAVAAAILLAGQGGLWQRGALSGASGTLGHLSAHNATTVLLAAVFALIAGACAWSIVRARWGLFLCCLAAAGGWYGSLRIANAFQWSNVSQVHAVETVNRLAAPGGSVLDGFTGYGCLRPHSLYYWWLNEHSLSLLPREYRNGLRARLT